MNQTTTKTLKTQINNCNYCDNLYDCNNNYEETQVVECINNKLKEKQIKKKIGSDTMKIDIEQAKREVQKGYTKYISSVKFVTYEDADTVLYTVRKDLMSHKNVAKFMLKGNMIEVLLDTNALLCTFYFTDKEVLKEVWKKLPEFGIYCQKI